VIDNGSGLSREERSSAQALTALLATGMHKATYANALQNSLAIAGVDGTVVHACEIDKPNSVVIGRAKLLKSGSLRKMSPRWPATSMA
jgi:serine-type D-Ala-D-Ala carboxypeptidase/endopeptidase (penicillin-binding protein 4)